MPHIFRPSATKPIPANAKRFTRGGVEWVKWKPRRTTTGAEWIEAEVLPNGRCKVSSPNWWVKWTNLAGEIHTEMVGPNYRDAERRAAEITTQLYDHRIGASASPMVLDHLTVGQLAAQYREHLESLGRDLKHCAQTEKQINTVAEFAGWHSIRLVSLAGWTAWVRSVRGPRSENGYNAGTINHYLRSLRGLMRWLVRNGRLAADPLAAAELLHEDSDRRHIRRVITADEFTRLLATTQGQPLRFHLSGPARAAIYLVAGRTGLRAGSLARLTRDDIHLDADIPHVRIDAKRVKNKKAMEIPLAPDTVAALRTWLADPATPTRGRLWPGTWYSNNDAAAMLRADLTVAGIPHETPDGVYDFHALRSQCGTDLARAGVPLTVAQKILGHSTPELTAKLYSRHGLADLADAVSRVGKAKEQPQ